MYAIRATGRAAREKLVPLPGFDHSSSASNDRTNAAVPSKSLTALGGNDSETGHRPALQGRAVVKRPVGSRSSPFLVSADAGVLLERCVLNADARVPD